MGVATFGGGLFPGQPGDLLDGHTLGEKPVVTVTENDLEAFIRHLGGSDPHPRLGITAYS